MAGDILVAAFLARVFLVAAPLGAFAADFPRTFFVRVLVVAFLAGFFAGLRGVIGTKMGKARRAGHSEAQQAVIEWSSGYAATD
ncbi:MAG: hypothetical protein ACR2QM_02100 [Longimicrobiales bacterium]